MTGAALSVFLLITAMPTDEDRGFQEWVSDRARDSGLRIVAWDARNLDSDEALERTALLCDATDSSRAWYVIEKNASARWVVEQKGSGLVPECSGNFLGRPVWSQSGETSLVMRTERVELREELHVALREGRPALVSHKTINERGAELALDFRSAKGDPDHSDEDRDLDRLRLTEGVTRNRDRLLDNEAALVPVLDSRDAATLAALPATVNKIVSGREQWKGSEDASVRVIATASGPEEITLVIQIQDDSILALPQPPKLDRQVEAFDHLIVRWCRADDGHCSRFFVDERATDLRELVIAPLKNGKLWARWRAPKHSAEALPKLSGSAKAVELRLPTSLLAMSCHEGSCEAPMTVCYSDSDEPGAGSSKMVCTSDLKPGVPRTYGALVSYSEHGRYPWVGRKLAPTSKLR